MTPSPSPDLAGLLARVEAATGPDRELDALIYCAIFPEYGEVGVYPFETEPGLYWRLPARGSTPKRAERFTASLDATLELCERVLPGCRVLLWQDISDDEWGAHFRSPDTETCYGATPALALLAAMLRALLEPTPPSGEGGS